MEWISVYDRLPDKEYKECFKKFPDEDRKYSFEVIVQIEEAEVASTLYYSLGEFYDESGEVYFVTHWMPLPEPPTNN